jgi:hypothetical protein
MINGNLSAMEDVRTRLPSVELDIGDLQKWYKGYLLYHYLF